MIVGLQFYLVISAILFAMGVYAALSRKNVIMMLMGIELILNAASLNFAAFNRFVPQINETPALMGQIFSIFVIILAAAEAAVAFAIVIAVFRRFRSINITNLDTMNK
jgi:NADH-quinone oxidoreductase subunit K